MNYANIIPVHARVVERQSEDLQALLKGLQLELEWNGALSDGSTLALKKIVKELTDSLDRLVKVVEAMPHQ